jgi:hypothetical protein
VDRGAYDTGSAAESTSIVQTLAVADSGSGAESSSISTSLSASDTGSGAESLALNRGAYDTGSGIEGTPTVITQINTSVADAGSASESVSIVSTISAGDMGFGTDTQTSHIPQPFFTPPLVRDIPNYLSDSPGLSVRLWRHYALKYRSVNVFLLSDGTYVQDTATAENGDTGYPLPWILNDPLNEISYVTNFDGSISHTYLDPHIVKVYYGSHKTPLTADEATSLTAAGYTVEYI